MLLSSTKETFQKANTDENDLKKEMTDLAICSFTNKGFNQYLFITHCLNFMDHFNNNDQHIIDYQQNSDNFTFSSASSPELLTHRTNSPWESIDYQRNEQYFSAFDRFNSEKDTQLSLYPLSNDSNTENKSEFSKRKPLVSSDTKESNSPSTCLTRSQKKKIRETSLRLKEIAFLETRTFSVFSMSVSRLQYSHLRSHEEKGISLSL